MEGTFMRVDGHGLIPRQLRTPVNILVYSFIAIQWVVILSIVWKRHPPLSQLFSLPVLYLFPLAVCFAFRQQVAILGQKKIVAQGIVDFCNDWSTFILCAAYGFLMEFRFLR